MRTPGRISRKRTVVSFAGAQTGDVASRDAAGRDIHYEGMDPGEALAFVRDYIWDADQARERQLERLADALELHEISERQRRTADAQERRRRQWLLNLWLCLLTGAVLALVWHEFALADRLQLWLEGFAPALLRAWLGGAIVVARERLR